ncbi:MAG: Gfo/Idh/MocA family oxidoreductase [Alphaproteobacteria bacterium]
MHSLVIVGLGRIGIGDGSLTASAILNHADAAVASGGFRIAALDDPDPARRAEAASRFPGVCVASRIEDVQRGEAETIALCAPTGEHAHLAHAALARRPAALVVEKPLAASLGEARALCAEAESAGVLLRVNFNRRFDPRHARWRARRPAAPRFVQMRYGKGLFNYASHLVDWLSDWYGPVVDVRALPLRHDVDAADPSPSFACTLHAGFDAIALGVAGLGYDQFEIEVLADGEALVLADGGTSISLRAAQQGKRYSGYAHLADTTPDEGPVGGFVELYAALASTLSGRGPLPGCDHRAALENIAVLEAVRESLSRGGASVRPRDLIDRS